MCILLGSQAICEKACRASIGNYARRLSLTARGADWIDPGLFQIFEGVSKSSGTMLKYVVVRDA